MPAPPELPSVTSDEQPAPARQARTHAAASQAQVGHDARAEAIGANV